ncbi:DoxX family membrane protein [Hydrotalea sp.]|uniref:DoxX family membrane protein n=1 Tax=Hydrotalea sp. TaxID=2881279 RepID=UPI00262065A4|nr:DoxX family membrane protein [Hydrotalea sp.]
MNTNTVSRISSIVFALVMAVFGINHLRMGAAMTGYIPAYFPAPVIWVYLVGVALILAAIAIIINKQTRLACYLLGLMLLLFVLLLHLPGMLHATDPQMSAMSMTMLLKDLGLAAGAFYIGSHHS